MSAVCLSSGGCDDCLPCFPLVICEDQNVAIDAQTERICTLPQAPERAEKIIARRVAVSTIYRWVQSGVRGVRLETRFLGGVRYTSEEAIQRFFDRVTASVEERGMTHQNMAALAPSGQRAAVRANQELNDLGL